MSRRRYLVLLGAVFAFMVGYCTAIYINVADNKREDEIRLQKVEACSRLEDINVVALCLAAVR